VVHRIDAITEGGVSVSLVTKRESRNAIESAVVFRERNGDVVDGLVPILYGSDVHDDLGFLLMEHVHPSTQGDALTGCTDEQAESLIRTIARIHTSSLGVSRERAPSSWTVSPIDQATWEEKLATTARSHPNVLDRATVDRLQDVPAAIQKAVESLGQDEWCWIHADFHLDNVVFRSGTSAVILDWASARIGPPAADLGHILTEGLNFGTPRDRLERWGSVYADEASQLGVSIDLDRLRTSIGWSIIPLLRGVIGWGARDEVFADRLVAVRENLLRNTLEWLDTGLIPIEI